MQGPRSAAVPGRGRDDAAVAGESGVERARTFREKADEAQRRADHYRRLAEKCEKGVHGEREVARLLDVLDGAGWRILHDRYRAAGSPVNIDHIAEEIPCGSTSGAWRTAGTAGTTCW